MFTPDMEDVSTPRRRTHTTLEYFYAHSVRLWPDVELMFSFNVSLDIKTKVVQNVTGCQKYRRGSCGRNLYQTAAKDPSRVCQTMSRE